MNDLNCKVTKKYILRPILDDLVDSDTCIHAYVLSLISSILYYKKLWKLNILKIFIETNPTTSYMILFIFMN